MAEKQDAESVKIGGILAAKRAETRARAGAIARVLGVSPVTVSRWERGLSKPDYARRADVERAYGLPLGAIGGVGPVSSAGHGAIPGPFVEHVLFTAGRIAELAQQIAQAAEKQLGMSEDLGRRSAAALHDLDPSDAARRAPVMPLIPAADPRGASRSRKSR